MGLISEKPAVAKPDFVSKDKFRKPCQHRPVVPRSSPLLDCVCVGGGGTMLGKVWSLELDVGFSSVYTLHSWKSHLTSLGLFLLQENGDKSQLPGSCKVQRGCTWKGRGILWPLVYHWGA